MEPEIGKLFTFPDGTTGYYLGGDVNSPASWSDNPPSAPPQVAASDAASWPAGSPQNPGGAVQGDRLAQLAIGAISPATLAGLAAGMAVPGGTLLGRMAGAGLGGVVTGALSAEPGNRIKGGLFGGLEGLGAGLLTEGAGGLFNAAVRRGGAGAGPRVGSALRRTSGIEEDLNVTRRAAKAAVDKARTTGYSIYEEMPPIPRSVIDQSNLPTSVVDKLPKGDVPFTAFQDLRSSLRAKGMKSEANLLSDFMQTHYSGLAGKDALYAGAMETGRTIKKASAVTNKSASDITWMRENLPVGQQAVARQAMVQKASDILGMRDQQAGALLKSLFDQGPEGVKKVRLYFPEGPAGDAGFNEFQKIIKMEKSAAAVGKAAKSALKWVPLGLFGYEVAKHVP